VLTDSDFVPFEPPPQPLGWRGLPTLGRNYVEAIPRAAYEEKVVRIDGALSDLLLVCDPDIVGARCCDAAIVCSHDRPDVAISRRRRRLALAAARRRADFPA
jgi:hypothetical protein